jgi:hypothetical protein
MREIEPTTGLRRYQSVKRVQAGEIVEVCAAGCYVRQADGTGVLRRFDAHMTARYTPVVGDYWIIYPGPDRYQSISPKAAFEDGYTPMDAPEST